MDVEILYVENEHLVLLAFSLGNFFWVRLGVFPFPPNGAKQYDTRHHTTKYLFFFRSQSLELSKQWMITFPPPYFCDILSFYPLGLGGMTRII